MKKEEAIKMLSNTKVYVDDKSEDIQKKLFEIGFEWADGKRKVFYTEMPFLYIYFGLQLKGGSNMNSFKNNEFKEIKADDILSLTIDKECEFKPFDRVLVRGSDDETWKADFFSHIRDGGVCYFATIRGSWVQCIPFEGNEHLLGTSDSPNKDRE